MEGNVLDSDERDCLRGSSSGGTKKRQRKAGVGIINVSSSATEEEDILKHITMMEKSISSSLEVFQKTSDCFLPSLKSENLETFKD